MNTLRRKLWVKALEDRTVPALFTVLNLNDSGADSLRDCISKANSAAGSDSIVFTAGLTGTITLASEIAINEVVRITGPGANLLTISGNNTSRIFNISAISSAPLVRFINLTFANGSAGAFGLGGAILGDNQNLELTSCVFSGNKAEAGGGAIALASGGRLQAFYSRFENNSTSGGFGGAFIVAGTNAATTLRGCTLSGNKAPDAGAMYIAHDLRMNESTITGNSATSGRGGGIVAAGTITVVNTMFIRNSTISGNSSVTDGGGIALDIVSGTFKVQNSTITANTAGGQGGAIARVSGSAVITIESTVVSGNASPTAPDVSSSGTVELKTSALGSEAGFTKTDLGGNLALGVDLKLGPLASNGGQTLTQLPSIDSPLIDVGSNPLSLLTDQRGSGFPRVVGMATDIGAVELPYFLVQNTNDSGSGSLRQAVIDANSLTGPDLIRFHASIFSTPQTIKLTSGQIAINDAVTIDGPAARVTIDGNATGRIFNTSAATAGSAIVLKDLTLTNGKTSGPGGAVFVSDEAITIQNCAVTNSSVLSGASGGGVALELSVASLLIEDSVLSGNISTAGDGGAITVTAASSVTIRRSTISGNTAALCGGAIEFNGGGGLTIEDSTLSGNTANSTNGFGGGGAVYFLGAATKFFVSNCTFSGNSAPNVGGGAILWQGSIGNALIQNSTITNNVANTNGGVAVLSNGTLTLESTIVAGNSGSLSPDLVLTPAGSVAGNKNLIGVADVGGFTLTGSGNLTGTKASPLDAKLSPLGDNGGPTQTHELLVTSPCINAGSNLGGLTNDQRGVGFPRELGKADIGAVEMDFAQVIAFTPNPTILPPGATGFEFSVTYAAASGIKVSTIDFNDVTVTGPAFPTGTGPSFVARPGVDVTPATARYGINAPSGGFTVAHEGTYTVTLKANQVQAVGGLFVPGGIVGTFDLTIQLRLTVDAINDERFDTDGKTSFREAIENANAKPGADTITFSAAVFGSPQTIYLLSGLGSLSVTNALTIAAPTARATLDASKLGSPHFGSITGSLTMSNMTLSNGFGVFANVFADLSLNNVSLLKSNSTAIRGVSNGKLIITDGTIDGNTTTNNGGAISWLEGTVTIKNSTISNNTANQGGGVFINGPATLVIENSTISGNTASSVGGGLAVLQSSATGTVTIRNSTITNNTAKGLTGGGIHITPTATNLVLIESTIIAGNHHPGGSLGGATFSPDLFGPNSGSTGGAWNLRAKNSLIGIFEPPMDLTINTANIIGTKAAPVNAKIGALAFNGGLSLTHLPANDSPVVNAGLNPAGLLTDQRGSGFQRDLGGNVDIGSIETGTPIIAVSFNGGPGVTSLGIANYDFKLTYSSDDGINVSTLDDNDLTVTGPAFPGGVAAKFDSVDDNSNGSPRTATYRVTAPAGGFTIANNGDYFVTINASQVKSVTGISAFSAVCGSFAVAIPLLFVVNATNDESTDTDGKLSLREAIELANATFSPDIIQFSNTVFATPQTIALANPLGQFTISDDLTIAAPPSRVTIDAGGSNRHFKVTGSNLSVSNLKLINGNSKAEDGGAILVTSAGELTLADCILSNNKTEVAPAFGGGGAISAYGATLLLTNCTVSNNSSTFQGGGILTSGGTVTIRNSTISNNTALRGGGFLSQGAVNLTIENSTVSGNSATETTVSGRAGGLGIFGFAVPGGSVTIRNSTITNNTAHGLSGGGIHITQTSTNPILIESTIIAGNTHLDNADPMFVFSPDLYGPNSTDTGGAWNLTVNNSLIGILATPMDFKSAIGNIVGSKATPEDAKLGPLADNGGPTFTHALLANSPCIDAGSNPASLPTDQRGSGFPRVVDGKVDIGAVESVSRIPTAKATAATVTSAGATIHTITVNYVDDVGINPATLGNADVTVIGPGGTIPVVFTGFTGGGGVVTATYDMVPPGGAWDVSDNGTYVIEIGANQVFDLDATPNSVPAGSIGSFAVLAPFDPVVTITMDENDGDFSKGDVSLREAIFLANSFAGKQTITFDATVFGTPQSIVLQSSLGPIAITDAIALLGPTAKVTVDGAGATQIIKINGAANMSVLMSGLTLANGVATGGSGGAIDSTDAILTMTNMVVSGNKSDADGGAVRVSSSIAAGGLVATNVTFSNNSSSSTSVTAGGAVALQILASGQFANCTFNGNSAPLGGGGAIGSTSTGTVSLFDCTITNNSAGGSAGFFHPTKAADFFMDRCTVSGNTATTAGGVFLFSATTAANTVTILNSTFNGNVSDNSGGVLVTIGGEGLFTLRNSTFSGNSAKANGGVIRTFGSGTMTFLIQNCTFTNNKAGAAGGSINRSFGTFNIESSVLAQDQVDASGFPRNLTGTFASVINSIVGNKGTAVITTSTGSTIGTDAAVIDAKLGPLSNNGGPTQTHALLPGSPCIDAGSNPSGLAFDQRGVGFLRAFGSQTDIGAFEVQPVSAPPTVTSIVINGGNVQRSLVTSIKVTFSEAVHFPAGLAAAFTVERTAFGSLGAVALAFNPASGPASEVTITFKGGGTVDVDPGNSLADGKYLLTIVANQISGIGGTLDGDGDLVAEGSPTDNKTASFHRLFGDADGNATVNSIDFAAFRSFFGLGPSIFDFNNDFLTNTGDFAAFRARFGLSLVP